MAEQEALVAANTAELSEKGEVLRRLKDDGSRRETALSRQLEEAVTRESAVQGLLEEARAQTGRLEQQVQAEKDALTALQASHAATRQELEQQVQALEQKGDKAARTLEEANEVICCSLHCVFCVCTLYGVLCICTLYRILCVVYCVWYTL